MAKKSKEQLLSDAARRGVRVDPDWTCAQIKAALSGQHKARDTIRKPLIRREQIDDGHIREDPTPEDVVPVGQVLPTALPQSQNEGKVSTVLVDDGWKPKVVRSKRLPSVLRLPTRGHVRLH